MQANIRNRTIFCKDNIDVLRGIDSESIDLVYLDPPFNKNKVFTAPIGSSAEGASFKDIFTQEDLKEEWLQSIREDNPELYALLEFAKTAEGRQSYNFCYLAYMSIRLMEIHRLLKDSGSVYLHCDPTMSHYLKLALDCIFGEGNFRNEIVWHYRRWTAGKKNFQKMHDIILRYSKTDNFTFNVQYEPYGDWIEKDYKYTDVETGKRWRWHTVKGKRYKVFLEDRERGVKLNDVWQINYIGSTAKERTGYPTQKPLALLERIILASSKEGDVVLDPFCGCATTCVAAEKLNRQWIGIDISVKAYELVKKRITKEVIRPDEFAFDVEKEVHYKTDSPERTDKGRGYVPKKYVYIISHPKYPKEYKVGIASNVQLRLNAYQTSDPNREYRLEYSLLTPHYTEIEAHAHNHFPNKHEWVQAPLAEIRDLIESYKGFAGGGGAGNTGSSGGSGEASGAGAGGAGGGGEVRESGEAELFGE